MKTFVSNIEIDIIMMLLPVEFILYQSKSVTEGDVIKNLHQFRGVLLCYSHTKFFKVSLINKGITSTSFS